MVLLPYGFVKPSDRPQQKKFSLPRGSDMPSDQLQHGSLGSSQQQFRDLTQQIHRKQFMSRPRRFRQRRRPSSRVAKKLNSNAKLHSRGRTFRQHITTGPRQSVNKIFKRMTSEGKTQWKPRGRSFRKKLQKKTNCDVAMASEVNTAGSDSVYCPMDLHKEHIDLFPGLMIRTGKREVSGDSDVKDVKTSTREIADSSTQVQNDSAQKIWSTSATPGRAQCACECLCDAHLLQLEAMRRPRRYDVTMTSRLEAEFEILWAEELERLKVVNPALYALHCPDDCQ